MIQYLRIINNFEIGDFMIIVYFFLTTSLFLLVIEIITVLFKLTGLTEEKARFQVISLITSTGFTSKESELITQHPNRRKLAQIVMIIGYVGYLTGISFLVDIIKTAFSLKNAILICLFFMFLLLFFRNSSYLHILDKLIENILIRRSIKPKSIKHAYKLITRAKGYGIYNLVIEDDSNLVGVTLMESNLKPKNVIILNIDKGDTFIGFPKRDYVLEKGDNILVYGKVEEIIKIFNLNKS